MRCNNLHILMALTGSMALAACGGKAGDTGDTGLSFAGDESTGGYGYGDDDNDDYRDDTQHNMAPTVIISSPTDGEVLETGEQLTFYATVSDDADPTTMLQLEWLSDVDGSLDDEPAEDDEIRFTVDSLSPGRHVISLEAIDTEGEISSSTVMITVEGEGSGNDDDDGDDDDVVEDDRDGDGFTTEDGDCNDNDWYTYPGADEYCDGQDNDCDGEADEDFWGDEESNNVLGTATDLGEIDLDGVATDAVSTELLGLTLHNADDEDWFRFDADDDYYDDIAVVVTYSSSDDVPVTMELYKLDWDTTIPWAEVTGTGELTLEEEGSLWTDDEDLWAVRIRPATDDAISCETTYNLRIEA